MHGITLKSAWFLSHRIREAMTDGGLASLGGAGEVVEADETYIGRKAGVEKKRGGAGHKMAVVSLVQRGGKVRSFHGDRRERLRCRRSRIGTDSGNDGLHDAAASLH